MTGVQTCALPICIVDAVWRHHRPPVEGLAPGLDILAITHIADAVALELKPAKPGDAPFGVGLLNQPYLTAIGVWEQVAGWRSTAQEMVAERSGASPMAFGRATRLRQSVSGLISAMGISEGWYVEVAAMLSQIGHVTLPQALLEKVYQGEILSEEEQKIMDRIPIVTEQVLSNIPRLEPVQEILPYQHKQFDGGGYPADARRGEEIPWGARALKVVYDLDTLEGEGLPLSLALDTLRGRAGWYDPAILRACAEVRNSEQRYEVRELPLAAVRPGMVLARDVATKKGVLFLARGQEVTSSVLEKLKNFSSGLAREDSIRVIVRDVGAGGASPNSS